MVGIAGTVVVLAAFFLPWMQGSHELAFRSFSGFDFARLIRNLEVTAGSAGESGQFTGSALAIYLAPALAVNSAMLRSLSLVLGRWRQMSALAFLAAGVYAIALLGGVLVLSLVPVNAFERVVGAPEYGFVLTGVGAVMMAADALLTLRGNAT